MTGTARRTALGAATAIGMSFAVFLWSPGAMAAAGCDTTTPSIGQTIVCDAAGTETITIPTGANAVEVVVIGGGGAGGSGGGIGGGAVAGADGGSGASVSGTFTLLQGTTFLNVKVGGGGADSEAGGDFSRLATSSGVLLTVAGGGGGGGFADPDATGGNGGSSQTGAGGGGGDSQQAKGATGGSGGSAGLGGAGGEPKDPADPTEGGRGSDYADDGEGAGGLGDGGSGGDGGNGYGGGGGGGSGTSGAGGGGAGGSYANTEFVIGSAAFTPATGVAGSGGEGGADGTESGANGQAGLVTITFIIIPTASAGSSAAAPRAISLDFTLPTGIECRFDSVEASLGSWIELPSASDCTITTRTTDTQPTLLGWATNADFPIDIAQRQVDNGWGAYETFNSDGQLTGVFIPAGGYTLVSNDTNLYPIFSS